MAKLKITEAAKKYITGKTKSIFVKLERHGSWAGIYFAPAVYAGQPSDPENYEQHLIENLEVYTPKYGSYDPEGVKIDLLSKT